MTTAVRAFVCTDVEGSTKLWATDADAMSASLQVHDGLVRSTLTAAGGDVFTTAGDSFWAAFEQPRAAVEALQRLQIRLDDQRWPGPELRVRAGVHVGEAESRGGDWFGPTLNHTARLAAAGHGGQVLASEAIRTITDLDLVDLGSHLLKDIEGPVRIWQVGHGDFPPLRATGGSNLPRPSSRLVGRQAEVRRTRLLLADHRLVTLVALGGTGKTRLALEVAEAELPHWTDGVWFVDLTTVAPSEGPASAVAEALGLQPQGGEPLDEVVDYLAEREALVVLDNCEHLIDDCASLCESILRRGGRSKILATAREMLDVDGEHPVQLSPLAVDGVDSPAVKLFTDRAVVAAPEFVLDDHVDAVVELCMHLDGLPLAIELAAARVAVLSPQKLVESLADRFRLLSRGRRRNRHRTLRAAIDWSHDALELDEQRVFRHLAVFSGTFDLDAVASLLGVDLLEAAEAVEHLVRQSLVVRGDATDRFRLLETIRAYAEDRLVDSGEADEARDRHAELFLRRNNPTSRADGASVRRTRDLLPERPNLMDALAWLERRERWDALPPFLFGLANVGYTDTQALLAAVDRCRGHVDGSDDHDWLDLAELELTMILGDNEGTHRQLEALGRLQRSTDPSVAAFAHAWAGMVSANWDPDAATEHLERARRSAAESDDRTFLEQRLPAFRMLARCTGADFDAAVGEAERVRRGGEVLDLPRNAYACMVLVEAVDGWRRGDAAATATAADEFGLVAGDDSNNDFLLSFCRLVHRLTAGELDEAEAELRRLCRVAALGKLPVIEGEALLAVALYEHHRGDDARARELLSAVTRNRTPPTFALAQLLRRRVDGRSMTAFASREPAPDADVKATLRAELDRRGWLR